MRADGLIPEAASANPLSPDPEKRKIRVFISTGEVSGDLQGALLVSGLYRQAQCLGLELEIVALGGARMAQAGATLLGNTTSISSLGLWEALPFIVPTLKIQRQAKAYLRQHPPDLVVMIDYMGPNVVIGEYVRQYLPHVPTVYYIAPQEWVCSLGRTSQIVKITDLLVAIFPEEARYYGRQGVTAQWVGHPLVDRMQTAPQRELARQRLGLTPDERVIALLPASRRQELKYLMPLIFEAARQIQDKLPDTRFLVPLSLETYRQPLEAAIRQYGLNATLISDRIQDTARIESPSSESARTLMALAAADLAITKSGTVNLEIALLNVPQIVTYRVSPLTAWVGRKLLKLVIPFASPPNLVGMREIVPEFIQERATVENLVNSAFDLLLHPDRRQQLLHDYQAMRQALGEPGVCDRAAQAILQLLQTQSASTLEQ